MWHGERRTIQALNDGVASTIELWREQVWNGGGHYRYGVTEGAVQVWNG